MTMDDSDWPCCGNGCSPCVLELRTLRLLKSLSPPEPDPRTTLRMDRGLRLRVTSVTRSGTSVLAKCVVDEGSAVPLPLGGWRSGQHVVMRLGGDVSRAYTPISLPGQVPLEFLIKSSHSFWRDVVPHSVTAAGSVSVRGPQNSTVPVIEQQPPPRLLMIAAGTGVAPMLALMRAIVHDDRCETVVQLVYGLRDMNEGTGVLVKPVLDTLSDYWNVLVHYVFSSTRPFGQPEGAIKGVRQPSVAGSRIDAAVLGPFVAKHRSGSSKGKEGREQPTVLVCGSEAFMASVRSALVDQLGLSSDDLYCFPSR